MNNVLPIIAFLALLVSASAEELRIARFDVKRVFDQYQHTRDLEAMISDKRHSRLPSDSLPSDIDEIKKRYYAAKERLDEARAANGRVQAGTPERERSDLQLQFATVEFQYLELKLTLEGMKRAQTLLDESQRQRAELLQEIWAGAMTLGNERGYRILVPDNLPSGGLILNVVVTGATDDLTEPLVSWLNERYAAKKSK